jgi:helix-turn-helix protein
MLRVVTLAEDVLTRLVEGFEATGTTHVVAGERLGLTDAAISRRVNGHVPLRLHEVEALADLLDLDVRLELVPREQV